MNSNLHTFKGNRWKQPGRQEWILHRCRICNRGIRNHNQSGLCSDCQYFAHYVYTYKPKGTERFIVLKYKKVKKGYIVLKIRIKSEYANQ